MNTQFKNLILVVTIYFIIAIISQQWEEPEQYVTLTDMINGFVHYLLLGYFSSKFWSLVLLVTFTYSAKEIITSPAQLIPEIAKLTSIKFMGLIMGIVMQLFVPLKVDIWSVFFGEGNEK